MRSKLSENLKAFRERSDFTQAEVAGMVEITGKNWSSYERGVTEPNIATLVKIANVFGVSTDELITMDVATIAKLPKVHNAGSERYNVKNDVGERVEKYGPGPRGVTAGNDIKSNLVMVSIEAYERYRSRYGEPDFIRSLPAYRLPGLSRGVFRMFELPGQQMTPTCYEGDHVVGRFVERFTDVRNDEIYVMLTKQEGIVIGRATKHAPDTVTLHSDSQQHAGEYPAIRVDGEDVLEIWHVMKYISGHMRKSAALYTRMIDLESRLTRLEGRNHTRRKK